MKRTWILGLLACLGVASANAQISYINILNHNIGSGNNNLFNSVINPSQPSFIDWEVWGEGLTASDLCGTKTVSRLVLRRMGNADPFSVIASTPIYVNGVCNGKNGNNDKYFANLAAFVDRPGRYSVEIQADVIPIVEGALYDNSRTATTWNYMCPPASYLTGANGPTGLYYTPTGSCSTLPGKSDPIGGTNVDKMREVNPALKYFTVGEADVYRQMVVFNGNFFDLEGGKFQPGNPNVPVSLNGTNPIPSFGICANNTVPALPMGAEVNIFKRTNCGADVTGGRGYYRVYKQGTTAPSYQSFNIAFRDNCPTGGPEGNIFPMGGSCNNINNVLDQRWQSQSGVANILPGSFASSDAGTWVIEFYLETDVKNCAGASNVVRSTVNQTTFSVIDPAVAGSPCPSGGVTPLYILNFSAIRSNNNVLLQWNAPQVNTAVRYIVERSTNGTRFDPVGTVQVVNGRAVYQFVDDAYNSLNSAFTYYRIQSVSASGATMYSSIARIDRSGRNPLNLFVPQQSGPMSIRLENVARGRYMVQVLSLDGRRLFQDQVNIQQTRVAAHQVQTFVTPTKGMYLVRLVQEDGQVAIQKTILY